MREAWIYAYMYVMYVCMRVSMDKPVRSDVLFVCPLVHSFSFVCTVMCYMFVLSSQFYNFLDGCV